LPVASWLLVVVSAHHHLHHQWQLRAYRTKGSLAVFQASKLSSLFGHRYVDRSLAR